LLLPPIKADD